MRKIYTFLFTLVLFSSFLLFFPTAFSNSLDVNQDLESRKGLKSSASTEINTTIIINDYPGSLTNWTWAKDQGYCTGLGTLADPYIIDDIFFNTSSIFDNSLSIRNSRKYFTIRDCEFKGNNQYAGVQLYNTTNGVITRNFMHPLTGALVWVYNASHNVIQNNNASAGFYYGVLIDSTGGNTKENTISENLITHNLEAGIQIRGGYVNMISDNNILNNTIGIELTAFTSNTTINGNHIGNSASVGLYISTMSTYHEIFENCFFMNTLHAENNGLNNTWDNGARGNYWYNYTGLDGNNDGIGDVPYNITGLVGGQDNFPVSSYKDNHRDSRANQFFCHDNGFENWLPHHHSRLYFFLLEVPWLKDI